MRTHPTPHFAHLSRRHALLLRLYVRGEATPAQCAELALVRLQLRLAWAAWDERGRL